MMGQGPGFGQAPGPVFGPGPGFGHAPGPGFGQAPGFAQGPEFVAPGFAQVLMPSGHSPEQVVPDEEERTRKSNLMHELKDFAKEKSHLGKKKSQFPLLTFENHVVRRPRLKHEKDERTYEVRALDRVWRGDISCCILRLFSCFA